MIQRFFFGEFAAVGWFVVASIFVFCASYTGYIVLSTGGGLRGTANTILFSCLAIVCACFGLILSKEALIPDFILGAVITAVFPPIVIAALVLTDIYASDRNNHRSFTARSYLAYRRFLDSHRDRGSRSAAHVGHGV